MKVNRDIAALVLRVGFGSLMFFGHGLSKLKKLLAGGDIQFAELFGLSATVNLAVAAFAEAICAALIVLGIKTKWASVPLIAVMAIAAFMVHGGDPVFNRAGASKEMALLYLIPFLALFFLGSGKYSVDGLLKKST